MNESYDVAWMIVFGTVAFLTILIFLISLIFFFFRRQLANQQEKQQLKALFEKELLTSRIEVQNDTFKYIAEELHDNIGQLLAVAMLHLNMLEQVSGDEAADYVRRTNDIIGQTVEEVRILTKSFDGDFVRDFGLIASLSLQLERIEKTRKFTTSFISNLNSLTIGYDGEIVLFRIAQEVINNILKHSDATSIVVELACSEDSVRLRIEDNGRGFEPAELVDRELHRSGAGLKNMHRRAALLGGTFSLESQLGVGTVARINIPITIRPDQQFGE